MLAEETIPILILYVCLSCLWISFYFKVLEQLYKISENSGVVIANNDNYYAARQMSLQLAVLLRPN